MPYDYISFKPNKQRFAIDFSLLPLVSLPINLSSRALRYPRGKCQSLAPQIGCISFNEQQTAGLQWHLGYFLQVSNPSGKNVERSAVLKHIARKTHSKDFGWIETQIVFQNLALNQNSGDQPKFQASVFCLIRYSYTSSSLNLHICTCVEVWAYTHWVSHWATVDGLHCSTCTCTEPHRSTSPHLPYGSVIYVQRMVQGVIHIHLE